MIVDIVKIAVAFLGLGLGLWSLPFAASWLLSVFKASSEL